MTQDLDNQLSKSFEDGGDYANRQRLTSVAGNSFSEEKDVRDVHPLLLLQMSCSAIKVLKLQQSLTISRFRLGGKDSKALHS
ncbi:hypothetical protein AB3S75_031502 [Citrus x aurantiifolia]